MVKKVIKLFLLIQFLITSAYLISFEIYINIEIAFLSSFFIILGSAYAYKTMVNTQVKADIVNEQRDLLDSIEDPHELYDNYEINETPVEELDLKEIVKEERKKIKTLNLKDIKKGSRAGFSPYRLVPYIFLILGFIALENNHILNIKIYLPSILLGVIVAHLTIKDIILVNNRGE
jgi:hypothetical protein